MISIKSLMIVSDSSKGQQCLASSRTWTFRQDDGMIWLIPDIPYLATPADWLAYGTVERSPPR